MIEDKDLIYKIIMTNLDFVNNILEANHFKKSMERIQEIKKYMPLIYKVSNDKKGKNIK